jgi:hypothetical protein
VNNVKNSHYTVTQLFLTNIPLIFQHLIQKKMKQKEDCKSGQGTKDAKIKNESKSGKGANQKPKPKKKGTIVAGE